MQAEESSNPHDVEVPSITHANINGLPHNNMLLSMGGISLHNSDCGKLLHQQQKQQQQQDSVYQKADIEQHLIEHLQGHGTNSPIAQGSDHHRHSDQELINLQKDHDHGVVRHNTGDGHSQYHYIHVKTSGPQYAPAPLVNMAGPADLMHDGAAGLYISNRSTSSTMDGRQFLDQLAAAEYHRFEVHHAGMDHIKPNTLDAALPNDASQPSNPPVIANYSSPANMELSAERDRRFQQLRVHPRSNTGEDMVGANCMTADHNLVGHRHSLMSLDSSYGLSSGIIAHDHQQQDIQSQAVQLQQIKLFCGTDHNHPSTYLDEKNIKFSSKQHFLTELNAMSQRPRSHVNVTQGSSPVNHVQSKLQEASPDSGSLVHASKLGHLEASPHDSGSNNYTTMAATANDTLTATDCWSTSMTLCAGHIPNGAAPPDILSCADTTNPAAAYLPLVDQKELLYRAAALRPLNLVTEQEMMLSRPKQRKNVRISKDPQSVAARHRRQRISDKMRVLQRLVPGGMKMDTASMLEEAVHYLKFLKAEVEKMEAIESSLLCHCQGAAAGAAGAQVVGKLSGHGSSSNSRRCLIKQHRRLLNLAGSGTLTRVHQLKKRQQQHAKYCAELAAQHCVILSPSHSYTSSSSGSGSNSKEPVPYYCV